jgi:hypothetical protein
MRRAFGYAGAWLMATSVAVTMSWFGCAVVLNGTSAPPPEVLSSVKSRHVAGLPEAAPGATLVVPQSAGAAGPVPPRTSEPRTSRSGRPTPGIGTSVPTIIRHGPPPEHAAPSQTTPSTAAPMPTPAASPDPAAAERTFDLTGGHATLSFAPDGVQVVGVDPSAGYDWYIDQTRPNELWVIFGCPGQESDLYATWDHGPSANVTEYWW